MVNIKDPEIVNEMFSKEDFSSFKNIFKNYKTFHFDDWYSRYTLSDEFSPDFKKYVSLATLRAREIFNSPTLLPTYSLFAHYEGPNAKLNKHLDDNACTYTLDMCVYRKTPWDLWVSGKPYDIEPNSALAYFGNDQLHWRGEFPDKENNHLAMVFFHFAEPDHWYFTKGPSYIQVIRKQLTEEQWRAQ
jgi:hypothetical protein